GRLRRPRTKIPTCRSGSRQSQIRSSKKRNKHFERHVVLRKPSAPVTRANGLNCFHVGSRRRSAVTPLIMVISFSDKHGNDSSHAARCGEETDRKTREQDRRNLPLRVKIEVFELSNAQNASFSQITASL